MTYNTRPVPQQGPVIVPRVAGRRLSAAMRVMPAVVVMGARQTGKSTLVESHPDLVGHTLVTLDDADVRDQARTAPDALLARAPRHIIDEIQREPTLLLALKAAIDRQRPRIPGQFVLTGSANLLTMKRVEDSLAGRAAYTTLWPMSRREQLGLGTAGIWDDFFAHDAEAWYDLVRSSTAPASDWQGLARRGGYPTPALALPDAAARTMWFQQYLSAYLSHDLRDLSNIDDVSALRRLMRIACTRIGSLVNRAGWASDAELTATTAFRHLELLETTYQLVRVEAFTINRTKRAIKTPRAYWSDPGFALHIAGYPPLDGHHFENVVLADLMVWRDGRPDTPAVMQWRTTNHDEVDFVIELADGRVLPVECKTATRPSYSDAAGLRLFLEEHDEAVGGLLLHGGSETFWIAPRVLATPWWQVF